MYRKIHEMKRKCGFAITWALPDWVVYYCTLRLFAHGTQKEYGGTVADSLTIFDALERWDRRP